MNWLHSLFFGEGVAHTVVVLSAVIAFGIALGRLKIRGISLGITWVLFVGILFGELGMGVADATVLNFVKEFGLILFVYSIGMQVGPGFFSSLREGGLKMNLLAVLLVALGVGTAVALHYATGTPIATMTGILSGAVTNTPGLGAAQQAYADLSSDGADPSITMGYAVAYPLGVLGMILSMLAIKRVFRIRFEDEKAALRAQNGGLSGACRRSLALSNPALRGRTIADVVALGGRLFVISRVRRASGEIEIATQETLLREGDRLLVVCDAKDLDFLTAFIGAPVEMDWTKLDTSLEARRIMVSNAKVNGQTLEKIGVACGFSFRITRVNRAGIDLLAHPRLRLQLGDRVTVVGTGASVENIEKILGNSMLNLRHPRILPLFFGILLGVLLGSIPFAVPGFPQSVKLGLAGGPLIVAILLSRFGAKFHLATYMTVSANLMLREVGIALFLACVGLGAGDRFIDTLVGGDGLRWIGYGALITVIPALICGVVARKWAKLDYFSISGLLAGASTNPPALAYAGAAAGNDLPAVGYATVYPLTMFLRVLSAQMLILFFL